MGNLQPIKLSDNSEDIHDITDFQKDVFNFSASNCIQVWNYLINQNVSIDLAPHQKDESYLEFIDYCLNRTFPSELFNQPFILPWYQQLAWSTAFAVMILVAIIGNLIVIWIIVAHRRMRTVTNLFLLNLAIADFLLASGNAAFNFIFMLNSHWPFGNTFCVISNFMASLTVSTSVFTILSMSLDRFVAVIRPLRPRMTRTVAVLIIIFLWSLSSSISLPSLLYATTVTYKYSDAKERVLCFLLWPDTRRGISFLDHVYNIVFLVVTYVVPVACMSITYTWIGCILWGSKAIGERTDLQKKIVKNKQKVVHMLVTVMLLFAICWLPYHIYFLYTYYNREVLRTEFIQHVYLGIYWLAMSNSCYNPIVYYVMNARFRGYFKRFLCIPSSKQPSEFPHNGDMHRSLPMNARNISLVTSNRTHSSRLSFPRRKSGKNRMENYQAEKQL